MIRHVVSAFLALLVLPGSGTSQTSSAPVGIDSASIQAFADSVVPRLMARHHVPGAALVIVRGNRLVVRGGWGVADVESGRPVDVGRTVFETASVTKLITATAVMQLVDAGRLDLDRDVNDYLEDVQVPRTFDEPVTLHHLLTHTTGFETRLIGGRTPLDEQAEATLAAGLRENLPARVRPPGEVISYSNFGYALTGLVVERVTGRRFAGYMKEQLLEPLGMERSSFKHLPAALEGERATGYRYQERRDSLVPMPKSRPDLLTPAGGLRGTVEDLGHFIVAQLDGGGYGDGQVLSAASIRTMQAPQYRDHPDLPGRGYGFHERYVAGHRVVGHAGRTPGFASYLVLLPRQGIGFFYVQNQGSHEPVAELVDALVRRLASGEGRLIEEARPAEDGPSVSALAGLYRTTRRPYTTVARVAGLLGAPELAVKPGNGDTLLVRAKRQPSYAADLSGPYRRVGSTLFRQVEGDRLLAFRTGASGAGKYALLEAADTHERVPLHGRVGAQRGALLLLVLVLLSAPVVWTGGWMVRRWREKGTEPAARDDPRGGSARRARAWAAATSLLNLGFLVGLGLYLLVIPPAISAGDFGALPVLLTVPLVTTGLAAVLIAQAVRAWREGWWRLGARVHYTAVVLAATAFVPWLLHWNLLGYHF